MIITVLIASLLLMHGSVSADLSSGLILHYSFDSDNGGTVVDQSSGSYNGTVYGPVYVSHGGLSGGAYCFDGVDDRIIVGNMGYHASGTISFWMNADAVENWRNPFSTEYASWDDCIRFEESSNGDFHIGALGMGAGLLTSELEAGKWYHVVYAWDAANGYGYLNGKPVFTAPHPDPNSSVHPNIPNTAGYWKERCIDFRNVAIGNGYSASADRYWKGLVDEVRMYNRALTHKEVIALYSMSAPATSSFDIAVEEAADLCYNEFILPEYPDGLRASWGGVYSSYQPTHPDDEWYNPHYVISESTTLLAQVAVARDDEQTLAEMIDLLIDPSFHWSERFQLFQWILAPDGSKLVLDGGYANASGEEMRMLEVLGSAIDRYSPVGLHNYADITSWITGGLKGSGGGIGNMEAPPYNVLFENENGRAGYVDFKLPGQDIEDIIFILNDRTTSYGYSIYETAVFDVTGTNISSSCTADASSIENTGMEPDKCIDGDSWTRWSSSFFDPQWLHIGFPAPQDLSLMSIDWETAAARDVDIIALKSVSFSGASGGPLQTDIALSSAQETRFIRILLGAALPGNVHEVAEVRVFGPSDPTLNLASGKNGRVSLRNITDPFNHFIHVTDGLPETSVVLSGGGSQWLLVDLAQTYMVNMVEVVWKQNVSDIGSVQLQPVYESLPEDEYLIRPQYVWSNDGVQDQPVTASAQVTDITLGNFNFVGLYNAASITLDSVFTNALQSALDIVSGAMNDDPCSAGYGLFHNKYNIRTHLYKSEYGDNISTTLSNCDIATRTKAYADLAGDSLAAAIGVPYAQFLAEKYRTDGAIWAGYDYETGIPQWYWDSLDVYAFAAKLFIVHREFDLAEKIIREKILPKQRKTPCDVYYGAIMEAEDNTQAQQSRYKDAAAFPMLECMMALQTWLAADKGSWESSYPGEWTTVAAVTGGDGGEDILEFPSTQARYVRILCNQKINPDWGYSLFSVNVYGWTYNFLRNITKSAAVFSRKTLSRVPAGTQVKAMYPFRLYSRLLKYEKDYAYNKTGSVSSVQLNEGEYYPMHHAFDADSSTRWASRGGTDAADSQWIYVDLGSTRSIHKVKLLWENAYATDYEVQVAVPETE